MGCAFSQESEDSRYRRKQAQLHQQQPQQQHQGGVRQNQQKSRSPHQRPQQRSQQQPNRTASPQPNSNVYSPVKTATVNTRGSRTAATPIKIPTAAATSPTSSERIASPTSAGGSVKTEPEDIHFRRQHFDRNSVLRHSKKRSRKTSSPYAAANANAAAGASKNSPQGTNEKSSPERKKSEEEKSKDEDKSESGTSKENSSAAANTSAEAAPKRNATTISISNDGSSRVLTNGDTSPKEALLDEEVRRKSVDYTTNKRSGNSPRKASLSSATTTPRTITTASSSSSNRAARLTSTEPVVVRGARLRSRSRHEQEQQQQHDVIMAEEKSDECGRLI
jgi:hypothetical protein